jgi:hypothetical protein
MRMRDATANASNWPVVTITRTLAHAAHALHVHPNTLLYRVRRFEQISGRSLGSTESLAEVWLALRATAAVPGAAHRPAPA